MAISPYLAALRAHVGRALLLVPSVAVMPLDPAGRLLLVRSAETDLWQTVGGAIEPDETPPAAAVREAREETGLVMMMTRLIGVYGGPLFRLIYPNGDECGYTAITFAARVVGGTPSADGDETSEVRWFTPDEARALPVAAHTALLIAETFADDPTARFPDA